MTLEEIEKEEKIVLKFYADWCMPCKALAPTFKQVSELHPDIKTYDVNVDIQPELAEHFGLRGVPTMLFLKNGKVEHMLVGNHTAENINKMFETFKS